MIDIPRTLDCGVLLKGVCDPLSDLAPLGDPIPNGGPHLHRIVVQLTPFQGAMDKRGEDSLTQSAIPSPFNVRSFGSFTMGRSLEAS